MTIAALLVEDDAQARRLLRDALAPLALSIAEAGSVAEAKEQFETHRFDLVIADLVLPDGDAIALTTWIKAGVASTNSRDRDKRDWDRRACEIIILTGQSSVETAVAAMTAGARTYLRKPVGLVELRAVVDKALEVIQLRGELAQLREGEGVKKLIGESDAMRRLRDEILAVAAADVPVLLLGESGAGKELAARALHHHSGRSGAFVPVNATALAPTIVESELFGHVKGAFTGATRDHAGCFERADGGSLFLDEIGDLPIEIQPKLLRVLEDGTVWRLGAESSRAINVRFIAATNRPLVEAISEGAFRDDLYHRLSVVTLRLPPLCERRGDIPFLAELFLREFCQRHKKDCRWSPGSLAALDAYSFPGNVRELRNIVESVVLLGKGTTISAEDLQQRFLPSAQERRITTFSNAVPDESREGKSSTQITRDAVIAALEQSRGNRRKAAELLGVTERTFYRYLHQYDLHNPA